MPVLALSFISISILFSSLLKLLVLETVCMIVVSRSLPACCLIRFGLHLTCIDGTDRTYRTSGLSSAEQVLWNRSGYSFRS